MVKLRDDAIEWRMVEGEVVALDLRDSTYLSINPSGAVLWPLLVGGADRPALVERLFDHYGLDEDTASRDVDAFLAGLAERDLLLEDGTT